MERWKLRLVLLGIATAIPAMAEPETLSSWLTQLPDGYLKYVYEVAGNCSRQFCSPQYHGRSVTLNCRTSSSSGTTRYRLEGPKSALKIFVEAKLRGQTYSSTVSRDGSYAISHSAQNIADISHAGRVVGGWIEGSFEEKSYRHDPYLGWYSDMTYSCQNLKGGPLPESHIIETPKGSSGDWWSTIGTGDVHAKASGAVKATLKFRSNGAESDIGYIGVSLELSGHAPDNVRIAYVGGYDFKSHGRGFGAVDPKTGAFHLHWLAGPGEMFLDGKVAGDQVILDNYRATWPNPGWTDTVSDMPASFEVKK